VSALRDLGLQVAGQNKHLTWDGRELAGTLRLNNCRAHKRQTLLTASHDGPPGSFRQRNAVILTGMMTASVQIQHTISGSDIGLVLLVFDNLVFDNLVWLILLKS